MVAALGLTTGCGGSTDNSTAMPTDIPAATGEVSAVATVLDDGDGPMACLGGVAESLPPQCDGPPIAGLDWADVASDEANGVRWADRTRLVGTWDGETLTLTEPASDPTNSTPIDPGPAEDSGLNEQELTPDSRRDLGGGDGSGAPDRVSG